MLYDVGRDLKVTVFFFFKFSAGSLIHLMLFGAHRLLAVHRYCTAQRRGALSWRDHLM